MKKKIIIISLVVVFVAIIATTGIVVFDKNVVWQISKLHKFDSSGYEVTFMDKFDGTELDRTKWRIFNGKVDGKTQLYDHNYRGGYYSDDPDILYVKDGFLHIATKYKEDGKYGKGWYSSWIETSTLDDIRNFDPTPADYQGFAQKYGYFEVRCKCPPAEGLWSAFWLLPNEGNAFTSKDVAWSAKDGAEIDVMESQNYFRGKSYCQHVMHIDYGEGSGLKSDKSHVYNVGDMYNTFHTYGVEWTPDKLIFYIDGYKTYETKGRYKGKNIGIPKVEKCILLSVEIAGSANKNGVRPGIEEDGSKSWLGSLNNMSKKKSYDFVVDYVKVMKKK